MSYRPSSGDTPIITNYTPRGRPVLATFGALLVLGGAVLWGLASQGVVTLPKVSDIGGAILGTATPSIAPQGTAPVSFTTYRDPQHRFALFISNTWQASPATLSFNGQALTATEFTPSGPNLPNWRITFPSGTLPSDDLGAIKVVSGIFTAEGAKNVTPKSGPTPVQVNGDTWTRLDLTLQTAKGADVRAVAFSRATTGGAVLVIAEEQALTFATTDKQDFTPMLASLKLQG